MTEDKPKDLLDLQRLAAEEGRERALRARLDTLQLVTFARNTEPGHSDPLGRHPSNGRPVFPDTRKQGAEIKSGETWFCEMEEYRPAGSAPVYYGNPIVKVDASYLFDLRPSQVDKLLAALQQTSQPTLLDLARKSIQTELEKSAQAKVEAMAKERDSARAESDSLHSEVARLTESAAILRREVEALKTSSPTKEAEVSEGPARQLMSDAVPAGIDWIPIGNSSTATLVDRPSAGKIRSGHLRDGRYFVHVSPDRRLLLIRYHPEGNLVATGKCLDIPSLDVLRPFDRPEQLRCSFEPRGGGLLVRLREGT